MSQKWVIYCCDHCTEHFAIPKENKKPFPYCVYCGDEETVDTGEVLIGEVEFDETA